MFILSHTPPQIIGNQAAQDFYYFLEMYIFSGQ